MLANELCPEYPIITVLSLLSCIYYPVMAVLSWMSCHGNSPDCPAMTARS